MTRETDVTESLMNGLSPVAVLCQSAPGQMTGLKDTRPRWRPAFRPCCLNLFLFLNP